MEKDGIGIVDGGGEQGGGEGGKKADESSWQPEI